MKFKHHSAASFSKIELPKNMNSEMLWNALEIIENIQMRPGTSDVDLAVALFKAFKESKL